MTLPWTGHDVACAQLMRPTADGIELFTGDWNSSASRQIHRTVATRNGSISVVPWITADALELRAVMPDLCGAPMIWLSHRGPLLINGHMAVDTPAGQHNLTLLWWERDGLHVGMNMSGEGMAVPVLADDEPIVWTSLAAGTGATLFGDGQVMASREEGRIVAHHIPTRRAIGSIRTSTPDNHSIVSASAGTLTTLLIRISLAVNLSDITWTGDQNGGYALLRWSMRALVQVESVKPLPHLQREKLGHHPSWPGPQWNAIRISGGSTVTHFANGSTSGDLLLSGMTGWRFEPLETAQWGADACPTEGTGEPAGFRSNSTTDWDGDGCHDATQDPDDDDDGVMDAVDACDRSGPHWVSYPATDPDGDGCAERMASPPANGSGPSDADGDGASDSDDACPHGARDWRADDATDRDGDGCRDADEDLTTMVMASATRMMTVRTRPRTP